MLATAITDGAYLFFNAAVVARHRIRAANWSAIWYLLSAFAVISYTDQAIYVAFAALGSWVGAFVSITWLVRVPRSKAQRDWHDASSAFTWRKRSAETRP